MVTGLVDGLLWAELQLCHILAVVSNGFNGSLCDIQFWDLPWTGAFIFIFSCDPLTFIQIYVISGGNCLHYSLFKIFTTTLQSIIINTWFEKRWNIWRRVNIYARHFIDSVSKLPILYVLIDKDKLLSFMLREFMLHVLTQTQIICYYSFNKASICICLLEIFYFLTSFLFV